MILDVLSDAFLDSVKALPFLFLVYLLIEFCEKQTSHKLVNALQKFGRFGSIAGALIGCIPQCGFSVMASNLYSGRLITMGTLVAVFLSVSDEAIPVIVSAGSAESTKLVLQVIITKVIIAVIVGFIVDMIFYKKNQLKEPEFEEICEGCDCKHHGIVHSALIHTVSIFIFLFAVSVILGFAMELIGENLISKILLADNIFQPFVAAIVGFIPNCAASVVLMQLYFEGVLSYGSLIAGLCTGSGVGLLVLCKINHHNKKENLLIAGILYAAAVIAGMVISIFIH